MTISLPTLSHAPADRARSWAALGVWVTLVIVFAALLSPGIAPGLRAMVSTTGLLIAGVCATLSGVWRAAHEHGRRRSAWTLLSLAGGIVVAGNVWVAFIGADPIKSPSLVGDLSIAIGLLVALVGLLRFPGPSRGRAESTLMLIDGLIVGSALLLVVATLIYPRLLDSPDRGSAAVQALSLVFPIIDATLATVATLLLLRARRAEALVMSLLAAGFLLYATSDLVFAAQTARGTFSFGTLIDLGWIAGYLTLGLAAWVPAGRVGEHPSETETTSLTTAVGTGAVFVAVAVAAVVEVVYNPGQRLQGLKAPIWIVLIAAASTRQLILVRANNRLQRALERRVLERTTELRRLARQNEAMVTSVADGVYGVDQQGRVTFVNPSAAAALGYTVAELEGVHAHTTFHAPDHDGDPFPWSRCYIQESIVRGVLSRGEVDEYERADGTRFPVEITSSPLIDEDVIRGAVVVFRDVTERHEVDRMKDEFLSVVSHELRTPLTSIRGSLGLIAGGRMGDLPVRAESLVTVAQESTERLVRLIDDLLDIERMRAGAEPLRLARLEVSDLLDSAALQLEGLATSADITVEVGVTRGQVLADADRLMQTLINLLGNAIKFSPAGSTVRLESRRVDDQVHLLVRDEGRGIPPDRLESIFDRFEQVDSSDTRQAGGTGLGLTISRAIVLQHAGRIWVESAPGVGTTVHVELPHA